MKQDRLSALRTIFAAYLGDARQKGGLTHEQVAERMGVTEDTVNEWECGSRPIDLVELRAYCQAIDQPVEDCIVFLEAIYSKLNVLE